MPAYVISQVEMRPGPALERYRELAAASIRQHGGKYLVRGGTVDVLEGEWLGSVVVVVFGSSEQARAWYRSEEYQRALSYRDDALSRNLIMVEGL